VGVPPRDNGQDVIHSTEGQRVDLSFRCQGNFCCPADPVCWL